MTSFQVSKTTARKRNVPETLDEEILEFAIELFGGRNDKETVNNN